MAPYNIGIDSEKVKGLLVHDDGLKELIQEILNQILEAQASEAVGAEKFERSGASRRRGGRSVQRCFGDLVGAGAQRPTPLYDCRPHGWSAQNDIARTESRPG